MRSVEEVRETMMIGGEGFQRAAGLFERWQDERLFEDIADYAEALRVVVPETVRIDEPFDIMLDCSDGRIVVKLWIPEEDNGIIAMSMECMPYGTQEGSA